MKKALAALCTITLILVAAHTVGAQDYSNTNRGGTGTDNRSYMDKQRAKIVTVNPNPDLAPEPSGAGTAIWRKGPVMISPFAPARYGMGSKYLAAAPFPRGAAQDSANEAKYSFGGIKLFGVDF